MSRFALRAVWALAAIGLAYPARAQQPAAPKIVWNLGWQESQCTLTTGTGDLGISLWLLPGDPEPNLYVGGVPQLVPQESGRPVTVTLSPGGETFQGKTFMRPQGFDQPVLPINGFGSDFLAAFAKSDVLHVATQKGSVSIPIKGAGKAVPALYECRDVRLQEWGIDPKTFVAVRTYPDPTVKTGVISADDYPASAIDNNEMGSVVARLDIDAQGKVTQCTVVVSSRSKALDGTTCAIMVKRARYKPATDPDGRPTPVARVTKVDWYLSR